MKKLKISKTAKNLLFLLLLIVVLLVVVYIAYSYLQFSATGLTLEELSGRTYITYDELGTFTFTASPTFRYIEESYIFTETIFAEDVLTLKSGETTLYFYVIDGGRTLFNDHYQIYLHEIEV